MHPGASRQDGANEASCSGVSRVRSPISMLLTAGFGSSRKTMSLKLKKSLLKIGRVGGKSAQEVVWIHPCALRFACVNNLKLERASRSTKVLEDQLDVPPQ